MNTQSSSTNNSFAIASLVLGLLALVTLCTAILPLPLGALSILFAVLSRRKKRQLNTTALIGVVSSVCGMAMSLVIVVMSFMMLPSMMQSEEYREQLNTMSEAMYGISFDDMLEDAYGIDLDEILDTE